MSCSWRWCWRNHCRSCCHYCFCCRHHRHCLPSSSTAADRWMLLAGGTAVVDSAGWCCYYCWLLMMPPPPTTVAACHCAAVMWLIVVLSPLLPPPTTVAACLRATVMWLIVVFLFVIVDATAAATHHCCCLLLRSCRVVNCCIVAWVIGNDLAVIVIVVVVVVVAAVAATTSFLAGCFVLFPALWQTATFSSAWHGVSYASGDGCIHSIQHQNENYEVAWGCYFDGIGVKHKNIFFLSTAYLCRNRCHCNGSAITWWCQLQSVWGGPRTAQKYYKPYMFWTIFQRGIQRCAQICQIPDGSKVMISQK